MINVKINGTEYPTITINGLVRDTDWGDRETKAITLPMTYSQANTIFTEGIPWSIVCRDMVFDEETQQEVETISEYDNSEFCMVGFICDNRDGTVTVKMGKLTEIEELYLALLA